MEIENRADKESQQIPKQNETRKEKIVKIARKTCIGGVKACRWKEGEAKEEEIVRKSKGDGGDATEERKGKVLEKAILRVRRKEVSWCILFFIKVPKGESSPYYAGGAT